MEVKITKIMTKQTNLCVIVIISLNLKNQNQIVMTQCLNQLI